jgi:hypothetical protein
VSASRRSATAVGSVVAVCSLIAALALLVELVLAFVAPSLVPVEIMPFFDRLRVPTHPPLAATMGLACACLATTGILLLRRSRRAPLAFLLLGWGGMVFTVAALWPGERLRFMMNLAVTNAQRQGALPDTTFMDLVPANAISAALAFGVIWLLLLIAGSVHVLRQRAEYVR